MFAALNRLYVAVRAGVIVYPGGSSAVLGIIVALAARYGFHLTITELMGVYALASAVVGGYIHYAVKAVVKDAVKDATEKPAAKDLS
jgi:hypothetical protein